MGGNNYTNENESTVVTSVEKPQSVKAKFNCVSVEPDLTDGGKNVTLLAVYDSNGENASFSKATPSGQLTMKIDQSTAAVNFFEKGKDYYLTFEQVNQ